MLWNYRVVYLLWCYIEIFCLKFAWYFYEILMMMWDERWFWRCCCWVFLWKKGYSSRSLTAYAVKSFDWKVCCKLLWLFFRICDSGIYVWKKREVHIYNRWVYQVGLKEGMFHVHFRVVGLLTIRSTWKILSIIDELWLIKLV